MKTVLELYINGQLKNIQSDPETPFIYVLRNELGLIGTKQGCSVGQCGACTIMVDGKAERACNTPTERLAGTSITTIEGLVETFIQEAFIEEQAAQCGYCIPGIIMTSAALLTANPAPSKQDIKVALRDNVCRCGTHTRILRAVENSIQKQGRVAHD